MELNVVQLAPKSIAVFYPRNLYEIFNKNDSLYLEIFHSVNNKLEKFITL